MWDFSLTQAIGLMVRTAPYIFFRMAVYFGIAAAYVIVTGTTAGIGWGVGAFGDDDFQATTTFWGGLVGFGLTAGVLYFAREYLLYLVKAGHIAVLVELIDGHRLPEGSGQVAYGSKVVRERFAEASVLFAIDQLVKGVVSAVTGLARGLLSILPIPGFQTLAGMVHGFLKVAIGFIDEVILAYAIRTRSENPWASAQEALVLYGQNYKVMLKNAAFVALFIYLLSFVVFLIMLAPAAAIVYLMPGTWSAGGLVFAILFAWAFKQALLEPLAIACMMQVYFRTIEGQSPDPQWDQRLSEVSSKFQEIKDQAVGWVQGRAPAGF